MSYIYTTMTLKIYNTDLWQVNALFLIFIFYKCNKLYKSHPLLLHKWHVTGYAHYYGTLYVRPVLCQGDEPLSNFLIRFYSSKKKKKVIWQFF